MKRALLAVDPGIDGTGVAVWHPDTPRRAPAHELARWIVELALLESAPELSIEQRCIQVAEQLHRLVERHAPAQVVIEVPRYTGSYAGRGNNADALAKLNRLIGALVLQGYHSAAGVESIEPDGVPRPLKRLFGDVKQYRRAVVLEAFDRAGRVQGNTPGWGRMKQLANQDKIDASYAGLRWLGAHFSLPARAAAAPR